MSRSHPDADQPCLICDFVASAEPVYEDGQWFAGVLENLDVPGWIVLGLRRHAFDPMGMNPAEAASLGPVIKTVTGAIKTTLDSERVYVLAWGETAQHLHFLIASRGAEIPPEHRHADFWKHRNEYVDAPAAQAAAALIREAILDATPTPTTEEVA